MLVKWLKRTAVAIGAVLLLWVAAWAAVPPLVKWQAQTRLSALLHRGVHVGDVEFRPWTLELTVKDLTVDSAASPATSSSAAARPAAAASAAVGSEPLLAVSRLRADLALLPLLRGVPVIQALDIDAPRIHLSRLAPGRYDVDDLVATLSASNGTRTAAEPTRFALYNLQVRDGRLSFDDVPVGRRHVVEGLQLGLPFLSNLPEKVEVTVQPHLAFRLNGAPFDSGAQATPFAHTRHGVMKLAVSELDVRPYLGYLPDSLPVRLVGGVLSADLALEFTQPEGAVPNTSIRGWVAARDLALDKAGGGPLLSWRQMRAGLRDVQPLARRAALDTVRIEGAQLRLVRDTSGRIDLLPVTPAERRTGNASSEEEKKAASASSAATGASAAARGSAGDRTAAAWQLTLAALELADGRVLWNDNSVQPAVAAQLDGISLAARQVQWPVSRAVPVSVSATLRHQSAQADEAGRLSAEGVATDHEAKLKLSVSDLALDALGPYIAQAVVPRIAGRASAEATLEWSDDAAAPRLQFAVDHASLDALRVDGARQPAASLDRLEVSASQVDLHGQQVTLGSVTLTHPVLGIERDKQGRFNVAQWMKAGTRRATAEDKPKAARHGAPGWRLQVHSLQIDDGRVQLSDAYVRRGTSAPPLRAELQKVRLGLQDLAWSGDAALPAAKLQLSARVAQVTRSREQPSAAGSVDWKGEVGLRPLLASGQVRVVRFPMHLVTPYAADMLPVSVVRAEAGYTGRISAREQRAGWTVSAAGDVLLGDVHVTTRPDSDTAALATGADELLSWQSFALKQVRVAMKPGTRPRLEVGAAALNDFYSRLIVTEEGRFNLQEVRAPASAASAAAPDDGPPSPAPAQAPTISAATSASAAASASGRASAAAPAASAGAASPLEALPWDIVIGTTSLNNGRIDFTDHFVRPNYSAALTELNGELGAFSSTTREMATLKLRGRAAGTALLDISGQINPAVKPLALNIKARATDLELAPLSPYAGKYAGYAIERGKLSLDVAYRIDPDGRLEASNQLVLNQLTFGERIDSPSATKLPVLLAVALLKDRNGVIDINLPISGSVNDPKFSVGGIIFKLILNLLAKALTAPFALLTGGGGPDLSYVEFDPGTAVIAASGSGTLDKVAKALTDRPALHMTVTGAADPVAEREAYQRAAIEARLVAERRREGLRAGTAASAPVALTPDDRTRLVKRLYQQTSLPDKPRNVLGLAKDLPVPEMEALLRKHVPVTDDAMHEVALQRGLAVRDALVAKGLPSERLFLAAPKLHAASGDETAWTPRVQLSLSTK